MAQKTAMQLYRKLEQNLTEKKFLKRIRVSRKAMIGMLSGQNWKQKAARLSELRQPECMDVLEEAKETLDQLSPEPQEGWLQYIYNVTIAELFPDDRSQKEENRSYLAGRLFYLETLRTVFFHHRDKVGFSPLLDMELLTSEELEPCAAREEYLNFKAYFREHYLVEFMRIGREITPYNTVGHICGVHYVALHVARQLIEAGAPVDLALVSGAAAGHDIGKFGCKAAEAKRIPYLHYYYTDLFLKRNGMPLIAHIASNHSTWDLELENLSVESLILIYADFRVKSSRAEDGEEIVHFYTLDEAFDVILGKLDNVDAAKTQRYKKVYAKLKDFEDYMTFRGINKDLANGQLSCTEQTDTALLSPGEVIDQLKYLAIEHNISLMNKFNNEAAFGNLIEAARSEKQWKNVRAYINILDEYSTYMTQKQKLMTLQFLYDLLTHREGDIRRQAATLIGELITNYDEEYRKELPEGVTRDKEEADSFDLWKQYLKRIIFPDHKVTDQHKRWIGYTLKIVLRSALEHSRAEDRKQYLVIFLEAFKNIHIDDSAVFVLLDSMLNIPLEMCSRAEIILLMEFAHQVSLRDPLEIKIGALRFTKYIAEADTDSDIEELAEAVMNNVVDHGEILSIVYLKYKIKDRLNMFDDKRREYEALLNRGEETTSDIFLENLKVDTPWVIKAVNIEFLLDEVKQGKLGEVLHVATHLSNLIKVSERVTVRHIAGKGLMEVIQLLPLDQRNELVIELTKGLEIGEYQFSKYIPEYLGALALFLHPNELDELLGDFWKLLENTNEKIASVTLDTVGEIIKRFPEYLKRFPQPEEAFDKRKQSMLGMLLRGLANYNEVVSQEAFMVIGQHIFGSPMLPLERKYNIFQRIYKKMLTLVVDQREHELTFFTNAAALNHIYRFISEYILKYGSFHLPEREKIAFFPGTFDPFSLSHKGIVTSIRDLGFEVYLALDEFSWSKKTQPRMIRRKIITMSVADEGNVYIFPDDEPINIANPEDLAKLYQLLPDKELYIVVGSDVVINASSYKTEPSKNSIHTFNHVVFRRESAVEGEEKGGDDLTEAYKMITGKVVELTLPVYLEDISSTRIRENIDYNRDISNLIDSVAQNYIYDNSLYLREPQYKNIMHTKMIRFEPLHYRGSGILCDLEAEIKRRGHNFYRLKDYLNKSEVRTTAIRDGSRGDQVCALAAVKEIDTSHLYEEFRNADMAAYLREKATGRIMVIGGIYFNHETRIRDIVQLMLTETLSQALKEDVTYAVYHPIVGEDQNKTIHLVLQRQGFQEIFIDGRGTGIFEVDMKSPLSVFQNMDTVLKDPFDKNEKVLETVEQAHIDLQLALTKLYPGNLVLSFNSGVMHHKIINMVTRANGVPAEPAKVRNLGPYMCVPFGKILRGMAVPNTVTKAIHTEKKFSPDVKSFSIEEYPYYSPIANQVKTIQSFNRPVILVDDLLHKGYRMRELDPVLKENQVEVSKLVVGLLSGRGKDLMTIQGRKVDSAYFIPNLKSWFVESSLYPFIGGDGVKREYATDSSLQTSINLILPYVAPTFLQEASKEAVYHFSMVCLENARKILLTLEEEYQNTFERKLTLQRLSEVVISPRVPDLGSYMNYDMNLAPSGYLLNGIERLIRLESVIK